MARRKPTKKTKKRKNNKKKRQKTSLFGFLFKWGLVLGVWAGIFLTFLIAWYASELPEITQNIEFERKSAITIKAEDDSVIARYGDLTGEKVNINDLPAHLIQAVLAIEDRRFFEHPGMDIYGFTRAMIVNIRSRKLVQGGSTITQQLAKNLFLSRERTFKRKIQEALLAFWLERELTKDEILSAYLNRVYLGSGTYGVSAASELYFDKDVSEIDLLQSATIAGLLKAPSRYSPLNNPKLSRERAETVLKAMVEAGYIKNYEKNDKDILLSTNKPTGMGTSRYFADWVVDGLNDLVGPPTEDLIVETTFDPVIQDIAEKALTGILETHGEDRHISQGAIIVMRPDGAVLAMIGGRDYKRSQFNRVTQAIRQPGSSFKPFVYLTAIENGWGPNDKIQDTPFEEYESYKPENFAEKYFEEVTLEFALSRSLNTAAVRLMKAVGVGNVIKTAKKLGIISPLEPDLSLALGSSSVSMLEMALAYAAIANGGHRVYPYAIAQIESAEDGTLYYQRPEHRNLQRVAEERDIAILRHMMEKVLLEGTGRGANPGFRAAGKTGTSQNSRDAWFMGFTDELVVGVWLGNDDNSPMKNVTGGSFPAQIWRQIMTKSEGAYEPIRGYTSGFSGLMGRLVGSNSRPRYNE